MVNAPSAETLLEAHKQYQTHEGRDSMYKVATFLLASFWGRPADMADGLGVLLLTWNQAFYRYGPFEFKLLEDEIARSLATIDRFHKIDIKTLDDDDFVSIERLFKSFLEALQIRKGKKHGVSSPVAVVKALHLLAPACFPLWDYAIAKAYGCSYKSSNAASAASSYTRFVMKSREVVAMARTYYPDPPVPILKLLDEYNYARFTKKWIHDDVFDPTLVSV